MSIELVKNLNEHSKWIEQESQNRLNSYLITVSILLATSAATISLIKELSIVFTTLVLFISAMQILLGRRQNKYLLTIDAKLDSVLFREVDEERSNMLHGYKELAIYYTRNLNRDKILISSTKLDLLDRLVTNRRLLWLLPFLFFICSFIFLVSLLNLI